ncbi:calcium/sodium antiporter [bacterium]|nr:calcium/sodium antiporter [bacterium]
MAVCIAIICVGFLCLIKGADLLVSGSSALAKRLGISDLIIGLTIVAFGTSSPELIVNIVSSSKGNTEIAIGNILGSNIFNIFLILGVSSLIFPLTVTKGTVWKEIPFSLLAVIVLGVLANDSIFDRMECSLLTRSDGFILLCFFIIFLYYIGSISKAEKNSQSAEPHSINTAKSLLKIAIGFLALLFGGKLVVDNAVSLAGRLGVSQSLIGLTIVAAGTSLPELATSAVAAYRKNAEIAVGNIVGSNIFNIFFILSVSSLIKPLPIAQGSNCDILVLVGSSLLLFLFMFTGKRRLLDRWEGVVFIVLYLAYMIFLVKKG